MIKHFCDVCEAEITDENTMPKGEGGAPLLKVPINRRGIPITVCVSVDIDSLGTQELCKYCILDAVRIADDRPRCA